MSNNNNNLNCTNSSSYNKENFRSNNKNNNNNNNWYFKDMKNQQDAVEAYTSLKIKEPEALLISMDVTEQFHKKFFVCNYRAFIKKLLSKPTDKRNFYEVNSMRFINFLQLKIFIIGLGYCFESTSAITLGHRV